MGDYVALTVLLVVKEAGTVTRMTPTEISDFARELSLGGKTTGGKKKKMDRRTIGDAMARDTTNFIQNEDGTFSLADELEEKKKTKTKTEKEIEAIKTAFAEIDVEGVLGEAKEKANNLNFIEGMGRLRRVGCALDGEGGRSTEDESRRNFED